MNIKITLTAAACALALAACGNDTADRQDNAPPAAAPAAGAPAGGTDTAPAGTAPADTQAPASQAPAPAAQPAAAGANGKPAAVVNDCSTTIEGNDAMQFNVGSITVPSSCSEFTITLQHTGQMPVQAMGHNVVITAASELSAVAADGMAAGLDADYVKPDDARVIAHTEMIGGGESTSVTFPVSRLQDGGPYQFFCSFPGHSAIMKGSIQVG
jgi:azurin